MLTILLFIDCSKMEQKRINIRSYTKEKPYMINSHFFAKLGRQKKSIGWAKYMSVSKWDMCWRNFWIFSLVTKKCENRSKIDLFSNEHHLNLISKKKTIGFFRRKLHKLHKKDTVLHVTFTFSVKQGETRTSSGPTWVALKGAHL